MTCSFSSVRSGVGSCLYNIYVIWIFYNHTFNFLILVMNGNDCSRPWAWAAFFCDDRAHTLTGYHLLSDVTVFLLEWKQFVSSSSPDYFFLKMSAPCWESKSGLSQEHTSIISLRYDSKGLHSQSEEKVVASGGEVKAKPLWRKR